MGNINYAKIGFLFIMLMSLFGIIGSMVGQFLFDGAVIPAMVIFLGIAGVINLVSFYSSDKIVLRAYRAQIVDERRFPRLYNAVKSVAVKADLPMPKVAIIPEKNPNAFATGRDKDHAVVAVTKGLLELLDDEELEGVIGHEMAHVSNRDMMLMSVAATIGSAISFIANIALFSAMFGGGDNRNGNPLVFLLVAITAPIAAMMIQMAISRSREFSADAVGAEITGKPWALASALNKLHGANKKNPMKLGNPSYSSLFIINPVTGKSFASLFSTHPPLEERIERLSEM